MNWLMRLITTRKVSAMTRRKHRQRRSWIGLFLLAVSLLAASAEAVRDVPPVGRLVDQAGLLNGKGARQVEHALRAFDVATGGQMAVLIIPSLDGSSLEGYSIRVADAWALGDKTRDDGLLLLIVVDDRKTRLEVGQGYEGAINDAKAGDMLRSLAPFFREKRYATGIIGVIDHSARHITGKGLQGVKVAQPARSRGRSPLSIIIILLAVVVIYANSRGGGGGTYTRRGRHYRSRGFGIGRGGFSGGGFSGGGFSGGGGGFSGGGASGGW